MQRNHETVRRDVVGCEKMIIYLIYELHNGVKPRLRTGYTNKRKALKKVEEWNNRELKEDSDHRYYMKEFEVIE